MALEILLVRSVEDVEGVRVLFREYAQSLGIDLGYQGFDDELRTLPGAYASPQGRLFIAIDSGRAAGCVALRPLAAGTAEMKRLYVRPEFQGRGLGRSLAEAVIREAKVIGYPTLLLDTLPTMRGAIRLYESLGFVRRSAYFETPVEGNVFMELTL